METFTIDFDSPIPLFPLAQVTLLPHAPLPLHIFEPRYLQLVHDALHSRRLIAMATFEKNVDENSINADKTNALSLAIRPHVCVGVISQNFPMSDGRSNILLQGVCRAKIIEEYPHSPYRQALLCPTESEAILDAHLQAYRQKIEQLIQDPILLQLEAISTIQGWLSEEVPTLPLIDLLASSLCQNTEERYTLLAEPDAAQRAQTIENLLLKTRRTLILADHHKQGIMQSDYYTN